MNITDAVTEATNEYAAGKLSQRDLVIAFMRENRGEIWTPAQVSRAVTPEGRARLGLRDVMARLCQDGVISRAMTDKVAYFLPDA